jgi:dTDP-4-amino-4,6-dideoxygalactose transaminase
VHRHRAYAGHRDAELPVTDAVCERVRRLPFFPDLTFEAVDGIGEAIARLAEHAEDVRRELAGTGT